MSEKVNEWLASKGVTVVYHHDETVPNQLCLTTKTVKIREIDDKQQQLFALLHEAGHVFLSQDRKKYEELYPWKYHEDPPINLWLKDLIQEEYDAWRTGFEIAEALLLDIDLESYEGHAEECLNAYRGFAVTVEAFASNLFDKDNKQFDQIFDHLIRLVPK